MNYTFTCECGYSRSIQRSIKQGAPARLKCVECGLMAGRDWKADLPMIDTSGCKDHNEIPPEKRVCSAWDKGSPESVEKQFRDHISQRRAQVRDAGGQRGSLKQTHSVPAHLFHGKIKETGDKNYWNDPKNVARHKECKVD